MPGQCGAPSCHEEDVAQLRAAALPATVAGVRRVGGEGGGVGGGVWDGEGGGCVGIGGKGVGGVSMGLRLESECELGRMTVGN